MDLRQLEYFVAVAEELSFTRAAARCRVAQSALSHQIARLERRTGVVLFERTSRAVRLAPAGELLLPRARAILAEVDDAASALAALRRASLTGRLRLGVVGSTGRLVPAVERALAAFHRQHPGVQIAVEDTGSRHMAEQVRAAELDVAFVGLFADQVPGRPRPPAAGRSSRWSPSCRGTTRWPAAHRSASPSWPPPARFVEMRAESGLRTQVDAAFSRAGVQRGVAFALDTSEAVVRYVGLGLGVAVVPASTAAGHTAGEAAGHGDVAALPLDDPEARHPVSLVHRRPEPSAPAARAFLALLSPAIPPATR